jgi:DNA mismatch repair protein MSH5
MTLGRSLLRTWLLRPSLSLEVIKARHDAVECFTRPENLDIVNIMHSQLGGIKNIPRILFALKTGKANLANWQGLVKVRVISRWRRRVVTLQNEPGT